MANGSEDTTTTSSTTGPSSKKLQDTLDTLLGGIDQQWNRGPKVYDQPSYVDPSSTTQQGWDMAKTAASVPWYMQGLDTAGTRARDLLSNGGLTGGMRDAMGDVGSVGDAFGRIADTGGLTGGQRGAIDMTRDATGVFRDMAAGATAPSLTEQELLDTARGKYLNETDPNYQAMVDRVANQTSADIAASMGYDGNFGSNVHANNVADQIGALRTNAAVTERNANLLRQKDALAAIEGTRQTGTQNKIQELMAQLSGSAQQFGQEGQGLSQLIAALQGKQGAAETAFGMENAGVKNANDMSTLLPQLFSAGQLPASVYTAVGGAEDADALAKRLADAKLWTDQKNGKLDLLTRLSGILNGTAGAAGTTTTTTEPSTPLWQTLAGLALGGLSLA